MNKITWLTAPIVMVGAFALDRWTKQYFVEHAADSIWILQPYLKLEYHLNENLALSLPLIPSIAYPLMVGVFLVLVYLFAQSIIKKQLLDFWFLGLILTGAIGNAVDRWVYGGVVDFIAVTFWSVFNFADIYIVGTIIVWIILLLVQHFRDAKRPV